MKKQFDGIFLNYAYCVHPEKVLFYRNYYGQNDYFVVNKKGETIDNNGKVQKGLVNDITNEKSYIDFAVERLNSER